MRRRGGRWSASDVRDRMLIVSIAVFGIVCVIVLSLWVTDTWRLSGQAAPALAARPTTPGTIAVSPTAPTCRSPLTSTAPLRLWIGGDSLAGSLGPALGTMSGNTGVAQPVFDSRVSSGLTNPEFFDWPQHATQEMTRLDPEVVVFIIGANDWRTVQPQPIDATGAPAWKAHYTQLVSHMLDLLTTGHRFVFWVGAPTMRDASTDAGVRQIDDLARSVVDRRTDATFVDAYQLFGDTQGRYSAELPGPDGKLERVRADDGIHFTPAGGDLLANVIFGPIDARCHLLTQAQLGSPKPVIETPGSTQLPNTYRPSPTTRPVYVAPVTPPPTRPPLVVPPTTTATTTPHPTPTTPHPTPTTSGPPITLPQGPS